MAFDRILVPLDGSSLAEQSLPHAERLAHAFGARLLLLRVLDALPAVLEHCPESADWRLRRIQAQRYLESVAKRIAAGGIEVQAHLAEGRAAGQIMEFARDQDVDLLVLCAYGWGGVSDFPFGGTVHKVVSAAGVSCAVVRPDGTGSEPEAPGYRRILVPLDGSRRAEWAVGLVAGMLDGGATEIVLLQVVPAPEMPRRRPLTREEIELGRKIVECNRRESAAYLAEVQARTGHGHAVHTRLEISPRIAETIRRVAEEEQADLIALTAHGASDPEDGCLGPVCQEVLTRSSLPVLVFQDVRPELRLSAEGATTDSMERKIYAPGP